MTITTDLRPPQARLTWSNVRAWTGLVGILGVRSFRIRFLRMRLGVLWAVAQPLLQALVLAFVFVKVFRVDVPHYVVYVLSGVVAWQCFQQCTLQASLAAVDNAPLLKKVPVPTVVFPTAAVVGQLIAFALQSAVLVGAAGLSGTLTWRLVLLPVALLLQTLLALGVGLAVGAFLPAVRDLRVLLETGLLMVFYATPVVYDPSRLSEGLRQLLAVNPMAGVMELHRAALLARPVDSSAVLITVASVVPLLALGAVLYHRRSQTFSDLL